MHQKIRVGLIGCWMGLFMGLSSAQGALLTEKPWGIFFESAVDHSLAPGSAWIGNWMFEPSYLFKLSDERELKVLANVAFGVTDDSKTLMDPFLGFYILPVFKLGTWKFNLWNRIFFPGSQNSRDNSMRFAYYFRFFSHNQVAPKLMAGARVEFKASNYKYATKRAIRGDIPKMNADMILEAARDATLNDLVEGKFKIYGWYNLFAGLNLRLDASLRIATTYSDAALGKKANFYGNPILEQTLFYEITPDIEAGIVFSQQGRIFDSPSKSLFKKQSMNLFGYLDFII